MISGSLRSLIEWGTPSNLSSREEANLREIACWSALRMLTAKQPRSLMVGWLCDLWSTQIRTSGGSSDTEENALAVRPVGRASASQVVMTVTPEAK